MVCSNMKTDSVKVSIIVPVFQSVEKLDRCIESVVNQKFMNWELLLLDDGSSDGSFEKCINWSKRDGRIKAFHHTNQGVGYTRNTGIEISEGKYILFLDADDEIRKDALERIVTKAEENDVDILIWGYESSFCSKKRNFETLPNVKEGLYIDRQWDDIFWKIYDGNLIHNIGTKLYRSKCIKDNKIRFHQDFSISEDAIFCLQAVTYARRFYVVNEAFYIYYLEQNKKSLSSGYRKKYMKSVECLYQELQKYRKGDMNVQKHLVATISSICDNEFDFKKTERKKRVYLCFSEIMNSSIFCSAIKDVLSQENGKKIYKVAYFLMNHNYRAAYRTWRMESWYNSIISSRFFLGIGRKLYVMKEYIRKFGQKEKKEIC